MEILSRIINPCISAELTLNLEDGSTKTLSVKEGDFVKELDYWDDGIKLTISGILKVIKFKSVASEKYAASTACGHTTDSYFNKCVTATDFIIDCSDAFESKLITVPIKNIAGFNGSTTSVPSEEGTPIKVRQVELVNDGTFIKWRYTDEPNFTPLIAIADITGEKGEKGEQGAPFKVAKVYPSIDAMTADFNNPDITAGSFVMIATNDVEDEDNGKLYVKNPLSFTFVVDMSGATGIQGPKGEKGDPGEKGEQGEKGDPGEKGDTGEDGFSPIVDIIQTDTGVTINTTCKGGSSSVNVNHGVSPTATVTQIPTGAVISVSDADGMTSATLLNGVDGANGVSPTATVTNVSNGVEISITDVNGTTTATVSNGTDGVDGKDGRDGVDGADGTDGVSPTASVTPVIGGVEISITDVNGTTTATILNGTDGVDGQDGRDGVDGADAVSPTATVNTIDNGVEISITDVNGTTTATVLNGTDGIDGIAPTIVTSQTDNGYDIIIADSTSSQTVSISNGEDGYSPDVELSDTDDGVEITVTTKDGTSTKKILNGKDGRDGVDGEKGDPGEKGEKGDPGDSFNISATYKSLSELYSAFATDGLPEGSFVIITTDDPNSSDNSKLFVKGKTQYKFINDLSGAQGIQGPKGEKGDPGEKGEKGDPGTDGRDGVDGVSPTILTKNTASGVDVTFTDKNAVSKVTIKHGEPGLTPIILPNPSNTATDYRLDITLGNNKFTTPNLIGPKGNAGIDGIDGTDGVDGKDGFTPTIREDSANVAGSVYRLEIVNKGSTFKTPNLLGADGADADMSKITALETLVNQLSTRITELDKEVAALKAGTP